jgi:O-antigen/teichoic acid export membrane protein
LATIVLGDAACEPLARWLAPWIALTAVGQLGIQLQLSPHRVKLFGILTTCETLGQLSIVALAIMIRRSLLVAVWGAVGWELAYVLRALLPGFRSVGSGVPHLGSLRSSLTFSLPRVPSYDTGTILSFADRLFIAAQLGAEAVGIYAAAYCLARIVGGIFVPIRTALFPAVSLAWDRGDRHQARWLLSNTLLYLLVLTIPAVAGLSSLGPQVLGILGAEAFAQGIAPVIGIPGIGQVLSGASSTFAIVLQLVQDTKALAVSQGVAAIVYIPWVVFFVTRWGLLGGALATLLAMP